MKYLFDLVKKQLERSEEEFILPGQKGNVGKAKEALKDKKLFRFLHTQLVGSAQADHRVNK